MTALRLSHFHEDLVSGFHAHSTEVGHKVHAIRVTRELALSTFPRLLLTKWKHVAAVAAPIGTHVGERIKAMGDAMVDLLFIRIALGVGLADAFRDDLWIASFVACVFTICTLHAGRVFEEVSTERTAHDIVKGLDGKLVAVLLNNIFLLLPNGAFSTKSDSFKAFSLLGLLDEAEGELYPADRLQREPSINVDRSSLCRQARTGRAACRCGSTSLILIALSTWRRLELQIRPTLVSIHLIGSHPACLVELGLNLLPPDFVCKVGYSNPKETNGNRMIARLVIYREFDFVRFLDIKLVRFIAPLVSSRGFCPALESIFDLHNNERFWASSKPSSRSVINVCNCMYPCR